MYTKSKEMEAVIQDLLKISEPQKGKFIGAFELCKDYKYWKERTIELFLGNSFSSLDTFFKDFEEQVKGEIVQEGDFFTEDEIENFNIELDDRFSMETVYPLSILKNTGIPYTCIIEERFTHFMILPVDYNRGTCDIGIAFMTRKGKKNYSQYLTGDY